MDDKYTGTALTQESTPEEINKAILDLLKKVNEVSALADPASSQAIVLPGTMAMFGGANAPNGWLLCDGKAYSRTKYKSLFSAIGVAWGVGDGGTTFNVPDMREASPYGAGTFSAVPGTTHGTITNHDPLALAAFGDDKMPAHIHGYYLSSGSVSASAGYIMGSSSSAGRTLQVGEIQASGSGSVTRGKIIGVNFIIKY